MLAIFVSVWIIGPGHDEHDAHDDGQLGCFLPIPHPHHPYHPSTCPAQLYETLELRHEPHDDGWLWKLWRPRWQLPGKLQQLWWLWLWQLWLWWMLRLPLQRAGGTQTSFLIFCLSSILAAMTIYGHSCLGVEGADVPVVADAPAVAVHVATVALAVAIAGAAAAVTVATVAVVVDAAGGVGTAEAAVETAVAAAVDATAEVAAVVAATVDVAAVAALVVAAVVLVPAVVEDVAVATSQRSTDPAKLMEDCVQFAR